MNMWISISIGWLYAIVIGHFLISWAVDRLWEPTKWEKNPDVRPFAYLPRLVGIVGRNIYFAGILLGFPELIAVWLALKVAGQWGRWEDDYRLGEIILPGRIFYNIFLIGTALSIAYSYVGTEITKYLEASQWELAVGIGVALPIGTWILRRLGVIWEKKDTFIQRKMKDNNA